MVCTCGQPVADATVCATCAGMLTAALRKVEEWLADELETTLTRQDRTARPSGGGRPAETPLPYSGRASEASWVLRSALVGWVRMIAEDDWPDDTLPAIARWLRGRVEVIRHHPAAAEALDEITAAAQEAERAVDLPHSGMLAGTCPECGRPVYAREGVRTARCHDDACDGEVDVHEWRTEALHRLNAAALPAADAARALTALGHTVTPERIRQWARRGKLSPADSSARYYLSDVRNLLETS